MLKGINLEQPEIGLKYLFTVKDEVRERASFFLQYVYGLMSYESAW
jgi:hypothetical protein